MKRHEFRNTLIYGVWRNMIQRTINPKASGFSYYGGRGIRVCDEWRDVIIFVKWATNNGYREGLKLDRINTDGNYNPSNCRFITVEESNLNRRRRNDFGIYRNGNSWFVELGRGGKYIYGGSSKNIAIARVLRDNLFNKLNHGNYEHYCKNSI